MTVINATPYAIINATPHAINIVDDNGQVVKTFEKTEFLARVKAETIPDNPLPDGTPTSTTKYGDVEGLPPFELGVYYVVSQMVKNALPNRIDLLVPAELYRDEKGNIIGCKSLGR